MTDVQTVDVQIWLSSLCIQNHSHCQIGSKSLARYWNMDRERTCGISLRCRSTFGPGMSVFQEYSPQMHYSILQPNAYCHILHKYLIREYFLIVNHIFHFWTLLSICQDVLSWTLLAISSVGPWGQNPSSSESSVQRLDSSVKNCPSSQLGILKICKRLRFCNWDSAIQIVNKRLRFCNSLVIFAKKWSHILKTQCQFSPEVCLRHTNWHWDRPWSFSDAASRSACGSWWKDPYQNNLPGL